MEGHSRSISERAHRDLRDAYHRFRKNACKDCLYCYDRLSEYDLYYPTILDYPMHGQRVLSEVRLVAYCPIDWQPLAIALIDLCRIDLCQFDLCQIGLCQIGLYQNDLCLILIAAAKTCAIGRDLPSQPHQLPLASLTQPKSPSYLIIDSHPRHPMHTHILANQNIRKPSSRDAGNQ